MKRLLSIVFTVVLVCGLLCGVAVPVSASSGTCGDGVYWSLENGVLRIYGEGAMAEYTIPRGEYPAPWKDLSSQITSVVIDTGITRVGEFAFSYCENLISVSLGESVRSVGEGAFQYCFNLESVTLNPGLQVLEKAAFSACKIPNITLPDSLQSIQNAVFRDCSLTSIWIPDSVTEIGSSAFYACTLLAEVRLSNQITEIANSTFEYCLALTSIDIPSSVQHIGGNAFATSGLRTCRIPEGVESIGGGAFWGCQSLESVYLSSSVTEVGVLSGLQALKTIEVAEGSETFCVQDGVLYTKDGSRLIRYPAGKAGDTFVVPSTVSVIGEAAFENCPLTTIELPEGVTAIEYGAFQWSDHLISLTIPESVTTIGRAICGQSTTIYGHAGSVAAVYAQENNIPFEEIAGDPFAAGDVNGDEAVDSKDARLVLQYAVGAGVFSDRMRQAADMNGDETIDSKDARAILQQAVA